MADFIIIVIIAIMVGVAIRHIIKAKKSGVKCIGCNGGSSCSSCNSCSSCSSCKGT